MTTTRFTAPAWARFQAAVRNVRPIAGEPLDKYMTRLRAWMREAFPSKVHLLPRSAVLTLLDQSGYVVADDALNVPTVYPQSGKEISDANAP